MIFAQYETRNFEFKAFAENEEQAEELLKQAWREHCKEFELEADAMEAGLRLIADERSELYFELGDAYRDREEFPLVPAGKYRDDK
jgi:hypothetical protein